MPTNQTSPHTTPPESRSLGGATVRVLAILCSLSACSPGGFGGDDPAFEITAHDGSTHLQDAPSHDQTPQRPPFEAWLQDNVAADGEHLGLYYAYYDTASTNPEFLSTRVSAQVARYLMHHGAYESARATLDALVAVQHLGDGEHGVYLSGAVPSQLDIQNRTYASSDVLAVIEAWIEGWEVFDDPIYRRAALEAGAWLRDVMHHGEDYGLWAEPMGGLMSTVNDDGAFDNRISSGRLVIWSQTLRRLSALSGDTTYDDIADDLVGFTLGALTDSGALLDHFDPGWPPVPLEEGVFRTVGFDGSLYADDTLRGAVGLFREGFQEEALSILRWLDRPPAAGFYGYVDVRDGGGLFAPGDEPYFDVVCTGLVRSVGLTTMTESATLDTWLASHQSPNGGWYWGRSERTDQPMGSYQATLTGLWAVDDMSPESRTSPPLDEQPG